MAYASICDQADSYENDSDPFFHYNSIQQMHSTLATTTCAMISGGNTADPIANAGSDITIPMRTPFILVGSASDANDPIGQLTYGWQQYDGAGSSTQGPPDCNTTGLPLFRYRPPSSDAYRHFPQYSDVLAARNNTVDWERLPCRAATYNFSLLARDNNQNFGRTDDDRMRVIVADTGPFDVAAPNGGETVMGGQSSTVTWTVNGTDAHCSSVDILLSTDGGSTYTVLADATPNDGTQLVAIPDLASTSARVLVRCDVVGGFRSTSTFYDVSNANFIIQGSGGGMPPANQQDLVADDSCILFFPKVTPGRVQISGSLSNYYVEVLDVNSNVVSSFTGNGDDLDIDLSSLPSSHFFLLLEHMTDPELHIQIIIRE